MTVGVEEGEAPCAASTGNSPQVFFITYSNVGVYEMTCGLVSVMRRKADGYMNATQILKVANVDKGHRTKILEREVQTGEHEKVQGGYGKYQGTWIPFERAVELARKFGVEDVLKPILEYVPGPNDDVDMAKKKKSASRPRPSRSDSAGGSGALADYDEMPRLSQSQQHLVQSSSNNRKIDGQALHRPPANNSERYRAILMSVFLNHENYRVPDLLTNPIPPVDLDIDLIIDDQGHTSLHWASALARLNILQYLLKLNADPRRVNFNGESALIRAVLVTNNFDNDSFHNLLALLHSSIDIVDKKGRTVFHHIALTAGIKGRIQASRYYLDVLLDSMRRREMDVAAIIDRQDKHGDTALNIACRIKNYAMVEQLLRTGSNPEIMNSISLRPLDFGAEDEQLAALFNAQKSGLWPQESRYLPADSQPQDPTELPVFGIDHSAAYKRYSYSARGKEMAGEFESVVGHLEAESKRKDSQLQEAMIQIRNIASELSTSRRVIQQLSGKVAALQNQMLSSMGELPETIPASHHEAEIAKLRAILSAHGLSDESYAMADGTDLTVGEDDFATNKANQLLAKVLGLPTAHLTGPGSLIDPLMSAVSAETDLQNMDREVSNHMEGIEK